MTTRALYDVDGNSRWGSAGGTSLPTDPFGGQSFLLRVGSTPFEFLAVVYDATLGKWVSPIVAHTVQIAASFTDTGLTYGAVGINLVQRETIHNAKEIHDAGFRPQVATIAKMANSGANNTFMRTAVYEVADGEATQTVLGGAAEVVLNGTTALHKVANWETVTLSSLTDPQWIIMAETKVAAGTGTYTFYEGHMRWVSA